MTTLTFVLTAVGSVLLLLFCHEGAHAFLGFNGGVHSWPFSGMPLDKIAATMEKGMEALGFLGGGCRPGAMFGKIHMKPARSIRLPSKCSNPFGHSRVHYAIGLAGLVCALPLFLKWRLFC